MLETTLRRKPYGMQRNPRPAQIPHCPATEGMVSLMKHTHA